MAPSIIALIIAYSLQTASTFNWLVKYFAEVEMNMNSIERLDEYVKQLNHEAPAEIQDRRPKNEWPEYGEIYFRDVSMRYRSDLPLVLQCLSFHVKPGERIGIVGRTGSGKSSTIQALFRMVELSDGIIEIDGKDIASIGLNDLRRRLAIIPQDALLFSGTLRFNLDPFEKYTDQQIWAALDRASIKGYILTLPGGLDAEVLEGGENFSIGQRQLIGLAKAMLQKPKILIMDEATASVDLKTDLLIQCALREDFSQATVLCIAHRLNTIIDFNKVLVIQDGRCIEFDTPESLLSKPHSLFTAMVNETGEQNADLLKLLAKKRV